MLKIDFYESGIGETIILTFPDEELGIIDANPSSTNTQSCRDIINIINGRVIKFMCFTHPHEDHGTDLVKILQARCTISQFWHTSSDLLQFFLSNHNILPNYAAPTSPFVRSINSGWAQYAIDLYKEITNNEIPVKVIHSGRRPFVFGDVTINILSPDENIASVFYSTYYDRVRGIARKWPDRNKLSAILHISYGDNAILLGGDALIGNWNSAVKLCKKHSLAKASLLKVPHHGAKNALGKVTNYFNLCRSNSGTSSVLFAGDINHPHSDVFNELKSKTDLICVANSRRRNPLAICLPGASFSQSYTCNPIVTFSIPISGPISRCVGGCDNSC